MKFRYRMVDMENGEVEEVEMNDPASSPNVPKTQIVTDALALENKFDPIFFSFGPPSRPGEPRPVAIIIHHDESPEE